MIFMFLKMAEKKLERPLNRVSKVLSSILSLCLGIVIFVIDAINYVSLKYYCLIQISFLGKLF